VCFLYPSVLSVPFVGLLNIEMPVGILLASVGVCYCQLNVEMLIIKC